MKKTSIIISIVLIVVTFVACKKDKGTNDTPVNPDPGNNSVLNLPATPFNYSTENLPAYIAAIKSKSPDFDNTPSDNQITNDGATLGRVLFYDKALSLNNKVACASCHLQDKAFTDGLSVSPGFNGEFTKRNSMSLLNLKHYAQKKMFWDIRASSLEEQVLMPIQNQVEMGITDLSTLETKLSKLTYYPDLFKAAFGTSQVTSDRISKALSQFIRSIVSLNSKYDDGMANNFSNFSASEKNGKLLFLQRCSECHGGLGTNLDGNFATFLNISINGTSIDARALGVANNGLDLVYADKGLGEHDPNPAAVGGFKIPMLRNIELTAPYMHDGRFTTLEDVLSFYSDNVKAHPNLGIQIPQGGFKFTSQEKADVVAFLKTLTDKSVTTDVKYSSPFK